MFKFNSRIVPIQTFVHLLKLVTNRYDGAPKGY